MPFIITAAALAAVFIFIIPYICYRMAFGRNRKDKNQFFDFEKGALAPHAGLMREMSAELESYPHERVYVTSRDGLRLSAELYLVPGADMTEIQFHGYRSAARRDFACGGCEALRKNHNLLLVDQRAHGESEGKSISFGIKERYDVLSWIELHNERLGKETEILLFGISMGAATVLMASELGLPDNVRLIVADCPYSTPEAIIRDVIGDMHLPPAIAFPFVRLGGLIYGGFDITSASPLSAVRHSSIPTLLIHGEADSFVPHSMSLEIYESIASEKKKLLSFPGADHGISYLSDRDRYLEEVKLFTSAAKTCANKD